ncbi:MAG: hypothetical protein FIB04_04470 [Gammaproteobacteria bacterium]|nr:hypothetical protein [Gammaproteobacteria bacterium]
MTIPGRVMTKVRQQDWFAVVVELLVVVLGIFIGLQVTDWNEGRKQARLADGYRQSLLADLEADRDSALQRATYFTTVGDYGRKALAYFERPPTGILPADASAMVTAFMLASSVWEYRQPRATFDDLKATGNLALIGGLQLRVELSGYYVSTDEMSVQWNIVPDYRRHVRSLIPPDAQNAIMAACEQIVEGPVTGILRMQRDCRVDLSRWDVAAILKGITESPGMRQDLTYWLSQQDLVVRLFGSQAKAATRMRARVEQERVR